MSNEIIRLLATKDAFINWFISFYGLEDKYEYEYRRLSNCFLPDNVNFTKLSAELQANHKGIALDNRELSQLARQFVNKIKQIEYVPMEDFDEELKEKIRNFLARYGKKPKYFT